MTPATRYRKPTTETPEALREGADELEDDEPTEEVAA